MMATSRTKIISVASTTHVCEEWLCKKCGKLVGWYSPGSKGTQATQCGRQHCKADNVLVDGVPYLAEEIVALRV